MLLIIKYDKRLKCFTIELWWASDECDECDDDERWKLYDVDGKTEKILKGNKYEYNGCQHTGMYLECVCVFKKQTTKITKVLWLGWAELYTELNWVELPLIIMMWPP